MLWRVTWASHIHVRTGLNQGVVSHKRSGVKHPHQHIYASRRQMIALFPLLLGRLLVHYLRRRAWNRATSSSEPTRTCPPGWRCCCWRARSLRGWCTCTSEWTSSHCPSGWSAGRGEQRNTRAKFIYNRPEDGVFAFIFTSPEQNEPCLISRGGRNITEHPSRMLNVCSALPGNKKNK